MTEPWIRPWLRDWAKWMEKQEGFSKETVIARCMAGKMNHSNFASSIPIGVEPPAGYLQRLQKAMGDLRAEKKGLYVGAVQVWYLWGPELTRERLNRPERTMRRWVRKGEAALQQRLS